MLYSFHNAVMTFLVEYVAEYAELFITLPFLVGLTYTFLHITGDPRMGPEAGQNVRWTTRQIDHLA